MSRSARLITHLARFVAGEAAPPARVRVLLLRERRIESQSDSIGEGSATLATCERTAISDLALSIPRKYSDPDRDALQGAPQQHGEQASAMGTYHELEMITILAMIEYTIFGIMVGRARQRYGVEAPATTGNPDFERYFRVHENTLEALIVFLPAVWIFALEVNYHFAVALGALFLIARIIYASGYLSAASKRSSGALATGAINAILVLVSMIAIIIKAL